MHWLWRGMRRKTVYLPCLTLLTLGLVWVCLLRQDSDIQWIGPKTKTIRDIYGWLELPIEIDDGQKQVTVQDALGLLYEKLSSHKVEMPYLVNHLALKRQGFDGDAWLAQVQLRCPAGRLTGRQLLKCVVARFAPQHATILVNDQGYLELTTKAEVDLDRAWYEKAFEVTAFDICRQRCCEMIGKEGHLPAAPPNGRIADEAAARLGLLGP
jgi:hypothetical protein